MKLSFHADSALTLTSICADADDKPFENVCADADDKPFENVLCNVLYNIIDIHRPLLVTFVTTSETG